MSKPAFPRPFSGKEVTSPSQDGMSLLEYYAGQADIPWNAVIESMEKNSTKTLSGVHNFSLKQVVEYRAGIKFAEAEAMVAEAEKRDNES